MATKAENQRGNTKPSEQTENARKLVSEYVPLKQDVSHMQTDLLYLEKVPEISDEKKDKLKSAGILEKDKSLADPRPMPQRQEEKY